MLWPYYGTNVICSRVLVTVMAEHRSKVFRAFKKTDSLRTTIPQVVVGMLGVEPGSELVWVTEPGSVTVTVRVARKR